MAVYDLRAGVVMPRPARVRAWFVVHRASLLSLIPILGGIGYVMSWSLEGRPDQGGRTFGSGVHAVIDLYARLRGGHDTAEHLAAGRELMVVGTLIGCGLLYVLARQLQFTRFFAALSVGMFGLSPIAMHMHHVMSSENVASTGVLLGLVCAASAWRSMWRSCAVAMCLALATMVEGASVLFGPLLLWLLWRRTAKAVRAWSIAILIATYGMVIGFFVLYVALKGGLSLDLAAFWRQAGRTAASGLYDQMQTGLRLDAFLVWGGAIGVVVGLVISRLRPLALTFLACVVGGFGGSGSNVIVMVLPLVALLIAGAVDQWWHMFRVAGGNSSEYADETFWNRLLGRFPVFIIVGLFCTMVTPFWALNLHEQSPQYGKKTKLETVAWIKAHVSPHTVVVVDDDTLGDLEQAGYESISYHDTTSSSEVARSLLPEGWRSVDVIALPKIPPATLRKMPLLSEALKHTQKLTVIGRGEHARTIYQVNKT